LEISDLEHFHQSCSGWLEVFPTAVFLILGFVSAQLQGRLNLRLRQSLAQKSKLDWPSKILAANRYISSVNALRFQKGGPGV
jgi:hypothetical protein